MDLPKSAENTLLCYANACDFHHKNYHFRSLAQTLEVKNRVYGIKRSLSTINRENRRMRDENLIFKWRRRTLPTKNGRQWTSSITHLTWRGVYYLVRRKMLPWKFVRVWERISKHEPKIEPAKKSRISEDVRENEYKAEIERTIRVSKLPLKILPYILTSLMVRK